jgi:hypothetical protein
MAITKRNPDAGGVGARKADLLGTAITSEDTQTARSLQVQKLIARFRLSPVRAAVVAELAFAGRPA